MKPVEAMYGWNPDSNEIDVGPWPDTTGWSDRYTGLVAPVTRTSVRCSGRAGGEDLQSTSI